MSSEVETPTQNGRLLSNEDSEYDTEERHGEVPDEERRVGFAEEDWPSDDKPRLHRKDTPHHLKNKRVNRSSDLTDVAALIAQVCRLIVCLSLIWLRRVRNFGLQHLLTVNLTC